MIPPSKDSAGGDESQRAGGSPVGLWQELLSHVSALEHREEVERLWMRSLRAIYPDLTIVEINSRFLAPWRKVAEDRIGLEALPRHLRIAASDLSGWQVLSTTLSTQSRLGRREADILGLHWTTVLTRCVGKKWRRSESPDPANVLSRGDPVRGDDSETGGMVGSSASMQALAKRCRLAAHDGYPALILGETGAGKEVAARLIHHFSDSPGRFVALNCAALPEALIESELFGHLRGAFTGAQTQRDGLFHEAEKGTLLLDEISEIPIHQQAKVLRALQDGLVRRVGSTKHERIDVRVIGTSNRDLTELLDRGALRRDLYYRLAVHEITVPPLREHLEDLPELTAAFLARWHRSYSELDQPVISPQGLVALRKHGWPGNVRELEHIVYRLASSYPGQSVGVAEVHEVLGTHRDHGPVRGKLDSDLLTLRLDDAQRSAIEKALRLTHGNKAAAARLLGVSRKTIYNKMRRYDLD